MKLLFGLLLLLPLSAHAATNAADSYPTVVMQSNNVGVMPDNPFLWAQLQELVRQSLLPDDFSNEDDEGDDDEPEENIG